MPNASPLRVPGPGLRRSPRAPRRPPGRTPNRARRGSTRSADGRHKRRTPWAGRHQGVRRCRPPERSRRRPYPVSLRRGRRAVAALVRLGDQILQMRLRLVLLHVERVHQLGGEDLLRAGVHLLLARREPLLGLPDGEVADDLRQLEDITGLDLLAVVLETPVPVLRHLAHVVAKDCEDLLYVVLPDHAP